MTYVPFARKYRPQTLEELVGQPHVTTTLARALASKHVAQAYLFAGLRGVGKTSAARILAKCLNCEQGPTPTPCNHCTNCTHITQGSSLDVIEIDGASNRGIDEIRSLRETVPYAPTSGHYRVYIIDEVHMLTMEAFNALLKTLEEPPAHVKFLFATTAITKVPATILSRCQRFEFRRIEVATIVEVLRQIAKAEGVTIEEPALYEIARSAEGSLRDAEVILEQVANFVEGSIGETDVTELLGAVESDVLVTLVQAILDRNAPRALDLLTTQFERGKDASQLLVGLLRHTRNLLLIRSTEDSPSRAALLARLIDEPPDRLKRLDEQASPCLAQDFLFILQVLMGAYELVRRSPLAHTVLELVVIQLTTREHWQSLEHISHQLERLVRADALPASAEHPARIDPVDTAQPGSPAVASMTSTRSAPLPTESSQPVAAVASPLPSAQQLPERSATASAVTLEELMGCWPVFLERLGAQKMSLAAYLADAKPLQLDEGVLTVGLPGFALHHEVLSLTENRRVIDRLLNELYQRPLTVQYTTLPESALSSQAVPSPAISSAVPPVVQEIVSLFNATILLDQPPRATG